VSCGVRRRHSSELALLWLWRRPVATATALIWPLAWEPPYAMGMALKKQKKKNRCDKCWGKAGQERGKWRLLLFQREHLGRFLWAEAHRRQRWVPCGYQGLSEAKAWTGKVIRVLEEQERSHVAGRRDREEGLGGWAEGIGPLGHCRGSDFYREDGRVGAEEMPHPDWGSKRHTMTTSWKMDQGGKAKAYFLQIVPPFI